MAELRKDSAHWHILRGPPSFGHADVDTDADFFVFDQIEHESYELRIHIEQYTRQAGNRGNRIFSGICQRDGKTINVLGIYRPGNTKDPGYIVDYKP